MKALKITVVLVTLLNLTGCWSKVELNELTFIYGLYVDLGDEPGTVEVTISSPLPNRLLSSTQSGSSSSGKSYSMVSKTAENITDAVILIQKDLSRRLEISHIKVIVVGKRFAERGIGELLRWMNRQPEVPLGTYILAAPGKAKDIVGLSPIFEQFPDQVLMNFSHMNLIFNTTLRNCLIAEASGVGYAINYLSFGTKPEISENDKVMKWAGLQGLMLFKGDRMSDTLNVEESRSLAWAAGKLAGHLTFPMYTVKWSDETGKGKASGLFYRPVSKIKTRMTPEGPEFTVQIKGKCSITFLEDSQGRTATDLGPKISRLLEEKINKEVEKAIQKTRESGTDVLQLGLRLEWNYPKTWMALKERWEDYYKNDVTIKVTTDIHLEDFGTLK